MTFEELKKEAKAQGYNLIPIKKTEKLLPCTCGCNRREHWSGFDADKGEWEEGLRCKKCGKEVWGASEAEVRKEWNKMIKKEKEHE